jgi:hypothetical protein
MTLVMNFGAATVLAVYRPPPRPVRYAPCRWTQYVR